MTFSQAVAKRTKELLFARDISQYKLIKETCLDKSTVQSIMKGKTKDINFSTVFYIADFFGMTISEFCDVPYFNKENLDY